MLVWCLCDDGIDVMVLVGCWFGVDVDVELG